MAIRHFVEICIFFALIARARDFSRFGKHIATQLSRFCVYQSVGSFISITLTRNLAAPKTKAPPSTYEKQRTVRNWHNGRNPPTCKKKGPDSSYAPNVYKRTNLPGEDTRREGPCFGCFLGGYKRREFL